MGSEPKQSSRVIISETDRLGEMVSLLCLSRIDSIQSSFSPSNTTCASCSNSTERQRNLAAERGLRCICG